MKTCSGQLSKRFKKFGHYDEGDDENGKHVETEYESGKHSKLSIILHDT